MDFKLTEEHELIQHTAREFARNEVAPTAAERDETETMAEVELKKAAELGFMGMMTPEEYGGAGMDTISYVIAMEEISAVDASVGVAVSVNNSLVCAGIEWFGTEEQKQKYLVPLAKGEKLGAYCLSEPGSGSDAAAMLTTARPDGDDWVLDGTKNFITNGVQADVYIVFANFDKSLGHKGVVACIVERDTPGFHIGKKEKKLGIRSSDTCSLMFENCYIPGDQILGKPGDGFRVAMKILDGGRIGIAAQALGIARGALEASINYANERVQFNKPIARFQAIQFMVADMQTRLDAARLLTYRAAAKKDSGEKYSMEAAQAKVCASETAMFCADKAVQIHGGYGYLKDFPVERYMRDAKITEIYEGTSEIQRLVIARSVLG